MLLLGSRIRIWIAMMVTLVASTARSDEPHESELVSIGGNWFVSHGETPVYYYRDAGRLLDLFSYHAQDSNKDGIPNVRVSHDRRFLIIRSQGYPNHPTAIFPNSNNPNSIELKDLQFRLPLEPKLAGQITRLPMGPIGMALNGVVFFNPFEAEGMNAVAGYSEVWLDSCCGHPSPDGLYHYHKYPSCVKSPFSDDGQQHSPVIGFAFDGFPVYGPYESEQTLARDLHGDNALDVCNGHRDEERGYHYHVTPGRFPYIIGGYSGIVETSNNRQLRRPQVGPIEDNQEGKSRIEPVIVSVRPGIALRGSQHEIQIELDPQAARRRRLPDGNPTWVQLGPYEATKIERKGDTVTIKIDIPEDATAGVFLDCHIEFGNTGRLPVTFKKNDAFRVAKQD